MFRLGLRNLLGVVLGPFLLTQIGCATLFGWDIHAPGLLSEEFARDIRPSPDRVALYVPEGMTAFVSTDKGNWHSDPQTYHIGEAFVPMLIEAFGHSFEEFILMEAVPTQAMMQQYGIERLVVVELKGFRNRKNIRGQGLDIFTETTVFGPDLNLDSRFETRGASEAPKVFAKKGGPEVNLNHAIEGNLRSVIAYVQDLTAVSNPQTTGRVA